MSAKIAIIEDDQAIREMYELKLKNSGYTVKTAQNGALGLELLKDYQPDLILLDVMMPEMNGDEMLKKYRATVTGSSTKVIVLTNISKDEAPKDFDKLGVINYIVKANHTPTQVIDIVDLALVK
jgi:DNA-binding response OmpR family regulator